MIIRQSRQLFRSLLIASHIHTAPSLACSSHTLPPGKPELPEANSSAENGLPETVESQHTRPSVVRTVDFHNKVTKLHNREKPNEETVKVVGQQDEEDVFGRIADEDSKRRRRPKRKPQHSESILQHDPADTFGLLAGDEPEEETTQKKLERLELDFEAEDERPHVRLSTTGRKNTPSWYGMQIEKLAKQGKIYEAIRVGGSSVLSRSCRDLQYSKHRCTLVTSDIRGMAG